MDLSKLFLPLDSSGSQLCLERAMILLKFEESRWIVMHVDYFDSGCTLTRLDLLPVAHVTLR
jgi:hypothetical protein